MRKGSVNIKKLVFIPMVFLTMCGRDSAHSELSDTIDSFREMHLGLFVHYMHPAKEYRWGSTTWADGTEVQSLDELADNLDVEDLAETAATMGAQYVIFTTWHANMNVLYPSEVMKRMLPGHCSKRDVIRDLAQALKIKGIRLVLYIHPSDAGPDFTKEDQDRAGWNDGPPYQRWNNFINEVVAEVADRYGEDLYGFYIDGGLPVQVDAPRIRKTIIDRIPDAILIQNSGLNPECVDYGALERMQSPYPASDWLRCQTITNEWWAISAPVTFAPEFAYQYTILQAAVQNRMGGGVAWSFGPHPGGRWELGVRSFCKILGERIERAGPSLFTTMPSQAYITESDIPLIGLPFVATESRDGLVTYLHILKPPKGRIFKLPPPANGRRYSKASLLHGDQIDFLADETGITLKVKSSDEWDDVDTIIILE